MEALLFLHLTARSFCFLIQPRYPAQSLESKPRHIPSASLYLVLVSRKLAKYFGFCFAKSCQICPFIASSPIPTFSFQPCAPSAELSDCRVRRIALSPRALCPIRSTLAYSRLPLHCTIIRATFVQVSEISNCPGAAGE